MMTRSFSKVIAARYDLQQFRTLAKLEWFFPFFPSPACFSWAAHLIFIWFHYYFFPFPFFLSSYISITRKPSFFTHRISTSFQPLTAVFSHPTVFLTRDWHIRFVWSMCSVIWGLCFKTFEFFFIGVFNFFYLF